MTGILYTARCAIIFDIQLCTIWFCKIHTILLCSCHLCIQKIQKTIFILINMFFCFYIFSCQILLSWCNSTLCPNKRSRFNLLANTYLQFYFTARKVMKFAAKFITLSPDLKYVAVLRWKIRSLNWLCLKGAANSFFRIRCGQQIQCMA